MKSAGTRRRRDIYLHVSIRHSAFDIRHSTFDIPHRLPMRLSPPARLLLERVIERGLFLCAGLSIVVTAGIVFVLLFETVEFLREVPITEFLFGTTWTPLFFNKSYGVLPLVSGTLLVSAIAMAVAIPAGLLSAIYLSEYAP